MIELIEESRKLRPPVQLDLEWAKQKIPGFGEMMATAQRVKASEQEYKKIKEDIIGGQS